MVLDWLTFSIEKQEEYLVIFNSEDHMMKIDYFMVTKKDSISYKNCNIIWCECLTAHYMILVLDVHLKGAIGRLREKQRFDEKFEE